MPFPGWMGVHRLLNLEVSAQRIRAVPVAAQKMGVSGSPCKQRAFWRRGCDVFCWWPGSSSCCVGWESSPGSALGRLWRGEHRPEKKMVLPSAWLLRTMAAVVGCRLGLRSFGGLLSRPLPSSASGGGILSFCAFYQEEIGARSSTVLSGPPHPGECAGSAGFSTRFCSQDPMAAAALMNWAQVSGESLSLPDSSVGGGVFSGFPNLAFVAHLS